MPQTGGGAAVARQSSVSVAERPDLLPTSFEIAAGFMFGTVGDHDPNRFAPAGRDPRVALESALRPCLQRTPCIVGFSGGRDSSALLAAAAHLAAREGLPAPVPVTFRFVHAETDERSWQELMLRHLGLPDWVRVDVDDELDFIGALATRGLRRHGVLYPPNIHSIALLAGHASGGSVLTGTGGDVAFGGWTWHDVWRPLTDRSQPAPLRARRGLHAVAPVWLRREILRRRMPLLLPWLDAGMRRIVARRIAAELAAAPRSWRARMAWLAGSRMWRAAAWSASRLGADAGVLAASPFLDPGYLQVIGRAGGRSGWGDRTATTGALFDDLLPPEVITRRTKATFSAPFFGVHTHEFAARWDGRTGIACPGVNADALRAMWTSERPHAGSAMALQYAWLASDPQARS